MMHEINDISESISYLLFLFIGLFFKVSCMHVQASKNNYKCVFHIVYKILNMYFIVYKFLRYE